MNTQFLYLHDPLTLEFDAEIRDRQNLDDGRLGVILTQTYFYPTGGGQDHDTGTLGEARVVDVIKSTDGQSVIHVLDGEPGGDKVKATIDRERRVRHMQHHTGQHILSSCFDQIFGLETLSSSIHGEVPTTIDLPDVELSPSDLRRAEDQANQVIFENRAVKSYFVDPEEIGKIPLRRPPKVSDHIRVVEVEAFDYSACGATHCPQTGMVGLLKIVKTERINQKLRIHFVAGIRALETFRQTHEIVSALAGKLSAHPSDVLSLVQRQAELLQATQKELQKLRRAYGAFEAQDLATQAETLGSIRVLHRTFQDRPANELRALSNQLKEHPDLVTLLATYDGKKLVLLVTCGTESGISARELLNQQLATIGGRGGGDEQIAQGGGSALPEQFATFFKNTHRIIKAIA